LDHRSDNNFVNISEIDGFVGKTGLKSFWRSPDFFGVSLLAKWQKYQIINHS